MKWVYGVTFGIFVAACAICVGAFAAAVVVIALVVSPLALMVYATICAARLLSQLPRVWSICGMMLALCLTGCASYTNSTTRAAEFTWLAVHAIDTAQTVTIARSPDCFYEKSPLARMVYGTKHPSVTRVLVTNTVMGAAHWHLGAWLDEHAERALADESNGNAGLWWMARGGFYAVSFMGSGSAVIGNLRLGVRPLSKTRCGGMNDGSPL